MWLLHTNREELIEVFRQSLKGNLSNVVYESDFSRNKLDVGELYLVWGVDPGEELFLPSIVIVADGEKRDFLAWVGTYIASLRPITRVCRVLEYSAFKQYQSRKQADGIGRYLGAAVGLILSEAIISRAVSRRQKKLSFRDCLETFSFAFGSALFSGASSEELSRVSHDWYEAQQVSRRLRISVNDVEVMQKPWNTLADLCGGVPTKKSKTKESDILELVSALRDGINIPGRLFKNLAKRLSINENVFTLTGEGTREGRVIALEEALRAIENSSDSEKSLAAFAKGYLFSQLETGSLDYISLFTQANWSLSEMALWYGFLAGLHPDTSIFDSADGVGWDVAIELVRKDDILQRPNNDLDKDEFAMLMTSERAFPDNKARRVGSLTIELTPGSETVVAIEPSYDEKLIAQRDLFDKHGSWPGAASAIMDIESAMKHLVALRANLEEYSERKSTPSGSYPKDRKTRKY
jgi:hypothetical protein